MSLLARDLLDGFTGDPSAVDDYLNNRAYRQTPSEDGLVGRTTTNAPTGPGSPITNNNSNHQGERE